MKKIIIIGILTILTSVVYSQNISLEVRGLFGYHRGMFDPIFPDNQFQPNYGIFFKKSLNEKIGVTTGLQSRIWRRKWIDEFSYQNYSETNIYNQRYEHLEIPVNVHYKWRNFYVESGININYLVNYTLIVNDEIHTTMKPKDMTFAAGMNINIGYHLDLINQLYLTTAIYYDYPIYFINPFQSPLMNYGIYMGIGYDFSNN